MDHYTKPIDKQLSRLLAKLNMKDKPTRLNKQHDLILLDILSKLNNFNIDSEYLEAYGYDRTGTPNKDLINYMPYY